MKTKLAVLLLLLAAAPAPAQTNNLTALLQQGLFEEQAHRHLDAAISNYQTLATQFDQDRALAATAIFRLGECYRAQGRTNEAAAQYQRILREFPDQQTLATLSRQDLAGLGMASQPEFQQRLQAVITRVPPGSADNANAQLWGRVKDLPPAELEKILPTLVPDDVLNGLLQQRNDAETKLAELRQDYNTNNLNVVREETVLKSINRQISEKIKGMMQALKLRAELPQTPVAASAPADSEDQEIASIQQMIQNSPDLINAASDGSTPLVKAAYNGWPKVAAYLLAHGADVNGSCTKIPGSLSLYYGRVTPLVAAVVAGNKTMTQFLIDHGADINFTEQHGNTPLHLAAEKGFQAVTEVLLAKHADVNAQNNSGITPLFSAVQGGQLKIIRMLLAAGAQVNLADNKGRTVLNSAIATSPEILQALLDAGADPNTADTDGRTPLSYAAENEGPQVVKLLLAAKADPNAGKVDPPLLCAIHKKDLASAELLLKNGANPNAMGKAIWSNPYGSSNPVEFSPLYLAVTLKQLPLVQLLLKFKADPNVHRGQPVLVTAFSYPDILGALLDAGGDVNLRYQLQGSQYKATLLVRAVYDRNTAAVETLLKHNANPNLADSDGDTPLHAAARQASDRKILELLLDYKAEPNVKNKGGETPLDVLKSWSAGRLPEEKARAAGLADLLRQHGALDVLPNWDWIQISRPSANVRGTVFRKGTNNWNQFTLFDLLGVQYDLLTASPGGGSRSSVLIYGQGIHSAIQNSLAFPDFAHVVIHRPSANGTNWSDLKINLAPALYSGDCAADVPLKFGDIVEIPEANHVLNEPWTGLRTNELFALKNCLTRHLQITVGGRTTNIIVAPQVKVIMPGSFGYGGGGYAIAVAVEALQPQVQLLRFEPFMLWPVLENTKLLLASSDLSHIVVKRRDAATGKAHEWTVDCSDPNSHPNFWLRDGDVIEVPEK